MSPDWAAIAVRAVAFLCLYQAAGAALFVALFARELPRARERVCHLGALAAGCGMPLVLAMAPLAAARMAGDYSGMFSRTLLQLAWHSSDGLAHAVQLAGLALIAIGLRLRHGHAVTVAVLGAVLAASALVLTGHTSVNPQRGLLAPLLSVHLLVVAFWFGALAPLWLALENETLADAAEVLRRFSALATWLVPGIALVGLAMAFILIDGTAAWRRPYGVLLLVKLGLFTLLMVLAALNRWRLTPALAPALHAGQRPRRALQRSIVAEYLLIAAVLAVTATLTTLFSPED